MKRFVSVILVIVLAFALSSTAFAWGPRGDRGGQRWDRTPSFSRRDVSRDWVCYRDYDCHGFRQDGRRGGRHGGGRHSDGEFGRRDGGCLRFADSDFERGYGEHRRGDGRNRR